MDPFSESIPMMGCCKLYPPRNWLYCESHYKNLSFVYFSDDHLSKTGFYHFIEFYRHPIPLIATHSYFVYSTNSVKDLLFQIFI